MSNEIIDIKRYKEILSSIKNEYVIELSRRMDNFKNVTLSLRNKLKAFLTYEDHVFMI